MSVAGSIAVVGTSLRNRRIRGVLIAFALFSAAEWVRWVGLLVYGFDKAGAGGAGWISVIQLVPTALITPFSSSPADRYPRDRVLIVAYLLSGLGTAGAGLAIIADTPFLIVALLAAVGMLGVTMIRPTQAALIPELAETPEELTAANVTIGLIIGASLFVGPGIASAVLAASGATAVVLVAAAMLVLGAVFVAVVRQAEPSSSVVREAVDLLGGFRELGRNPGVALIVVLLGVQAAVWGMVDVLIVTPAIDELGIDQAGVGVLSAALGIGAIVGGAASTALVGRTLMQRAASEETLGRVFGLLESGFKASVATVTDVRLLSLERAPFLTAVTGSRSAAAAAHDEIDRRLASGPAEGDHP